MDRKQHIIQTSGRLLPIIPSSVLISDEWRVVECYVLEEEAGEPDDVQDWKGGGKTCDGLAFVIHPYLWVE